MLFECCFNGTGNVESEKNVWTTGLSIFSHMCEGIAATTWAQR